MTLGYPTSDVIVGWKVKDQRSKSQVTKCKNVLKTIEWPA